MNTFEYIIRNVIPVITLLLVANSICEKQKNRYLQASCILTIGGITGELAKYILPMIFRYTIFNDNNRNVLIYQNIMSHTILIMFTIACILLCIGLKVKIKIKNNT